MIGAAMGECKNRAVFLCGVKDCRAFIAGQAGRLVHVQIFRTGLQVHGYVLGTFHKNNRYGVLARNAIKLHAALVAPNPDMQLR